MSKVQSEIFGNIVISGFVNKVNTDKRFFLLGTGSYTTKDGQKKYKSSVMVFIDSDEVSLPAEGNYIEVKADLVVSESTYTKEGVTLVPLKGTMNVRKKYQITQKEVPTKSSAPATPVPTEDDI